MYDRWRIDARRLRNAVFWQQILRQISQGSFPDPSLYVRKSPILINLLI